MGGLVEGSIVGTSRWRGGTEVPDSDPAALLSTGDTGKDDVAGKEGVDSLQDKDSQCGLDRAQEEEAPDRQ